MGPGTQEVRGRRERGGQRRRKTKRRMLVGDVQDYWGSTWGGKSIRFVTYNICNGRNGGLELALIGMSQSDKDLGIFQEIKLTDGVYTCGSSGYSVVTMDTPRLQHSGVAVFYWPLLFYVVDLFQPKISPTHSFSSMYQKSFIRHSNRTNS